MAKKDAETHVLQRQLLDAKKQQAASAQALMTATSLPAMQADVHNDDGAVGGGGQNYDMEYASGGIQPELLRNEESRVTQVDKSKKMRDALAVSVRCRGECTELVRLRVGVFVLFSHNSAGNGRMCVPVLLSNRS